MPTVKEYWIPMPWSVESYKIGQLYMTAKTSVQESGQGEGIEVLINEPQINPETGNMCQYTKKIYRLSNKIPSMVKLLIPSLRKVEVLEESWNEYPLCRTVMTWDETCKVTVKTIHVPFSPKPFSSADGKPSKEQLISMFDQNAHNLSAEELSKRTVDIIDLREPNSRLNGVKVGEQTGDGFVPLDNPNWITNGTAKSVAMKLISCTYNSWMFSSRIESAMHQYGFRPAQLTGNQQCYLWLPEWINLSMNDIREFEKVCAQKQLARINSDGEQLTLPEPVLDEEKKDKDQGDDDDDECKEDDTPLQSASNNNTDQSV